jgi:hypothetical protein
VCYVYKPKLGLGVGHELPRDVEILAEEEAIVAHIDAFRGIVELQRVGQQRQLRPAITQAHKQSVRKVLDITSNADCEGDLTYVISASERPALFSDWIGGVVLVLESTMNRPGPRNDL